VPPKCPLFRKGSSYWQDNEDDEEEGANGKGEGGDCGGWASDGDDDERQEDFLNLELEEQVEQSRRASFASPTPVGLSSPVSFLSNSLGFSGASTGGTNGMVIQYLHKGIGTSASALMEGWAAALVTQTQGLLFEDENVQVLLRHEYQQHQGNVSIAIKNVGLLPFHDLNASVISTNAGILVQAMPVHQRLQPGETANQQVRVVCMEPFEVSSLSLFSSNYHSSTYSQVMIITLSFRFIPTLTRCPPLSNLTSPLRTPLSFTPSISTP